MPGIEEDWAEMTEEGVRGIVVTGATRGIGRALTARFVELGHTVIGCGRSESGVGELSAAFGGPKKELADRRGIGVAGDDFISSRQERSARESFF